MENNKKKVGGGGSSSSSLTNFDHLFGPKDPSTTSSASTSIFGSIFPPPSAVGGRNSTKQADMGSKNYGASGNYSYKGESSGVSNKNTSTNYHQNETVEPSYYSSSIYYGGQENYSPRTRTTESHHIFKKDNKDDDDPSGNDSNSASRGNWWQGSLYY